MKGDDLIDEVTDRAQAFIDQKYVSRAEDRQQSLGLAYVEAERQDLARAMAVFADSEIQRSQGAANQTTKVEKMLLPDIDRIKRYRAENGCSLMEARNAVNRQQVAEALEESQTGDDLKLIIAAMLKMRS
jgi:ribosomal protein L7/L12